MNRTELIEKIIGRLDMNPTAKEHVKDILEKELPDFQRIDEERFKKIYLEISITPYEAGVAKDVVQKYNSTLPPALVPLPKATPYEFVYLFNESHSPRKIWEWLLSHYGTPEPKPELPSVQELAKEMLNVWNVNTFNEVAEYVIDKYSLHTREWWQGDFKGMKVTHEKCNSFPPIELTGQIFVLDKRFNFYDVNNCTPYTPPSAQDIIAKHNLSEEEVKILREGK